MPATPQGIDGRLLHFLKEMPPWVVLGIFVGIFLIVWQAAHDDFIPRIIDGLVGALLTSIVAQRPKPPVPTSIDAENLNTETVTAENLNVKDSK